MKVVITSDTHVKRYSDLPITLREEIAQANAVIHAGDLCGDSFYSELCLENINVYAVNGNNDLSSLPSELIIQLEEVKIAITHSDRAYGKNVQNWLLEHFAVSKPDIIVYGHSHVPALNEIGKQTLLNPGSPRLNRNVDYNSFVVMNINGNDFNIEFKKISK